MLRLTAIVVLVAALAASEPLSVPSDAAVDLSQPPYGALGDGLTDATPAIQRALADHGKGGGTLFLPKGIYLISDTLALVKDAKRITWQGAGIGHTVIRLKDRAAGFGDAAKPKAMMTFGGDPAQRFRNHVFDLTVHSGAGNPGAIGVQYYTSNQGAMMRVEIISGDGLGVIGLDTGHHGEIGPGLVRDLRVHGFAVGVSSKALNSMTMERLVLEDQRECALDNRGHVLSVRGLTTRGAPLAVRNAGTLTLLDATIAGSGAEAVVNSGALVVRDLTQRGYATTIANRPRKGVGTADVSAATVAEWTSVAPAGVGAGPHASLRLPVAELPDLARDAPADWVSPFAFGAIGDGKTDDTAALQKAIDSGATTVYLPRLRAGKPVAFAIAGELVIRGALRRFSGSDANTLTTATRTRAALVIADGNGPVTVERLDLIYKNIAIVVRAARPVVITHVTVGGEGGVFSEGTGDLFLTDVCSDTVRCTRAGQRVFMRQINVESPEVNIVSSGAELWILGIKTERGGIKIDARGGRVEVLGGFAYCTTKASKDTFVKAIDAAVCVAGLSQVAFGNPVYRYFASGSLNGVDFAQAPTVLFAAGR